MLRCYVVTLLHSYILHITRHAGPPFSIVAYGHIVQHDIHDAMKAEALGLRALLATVSVIFTSSGCEQVVSGEPITCDVCMSGSMGSLQQRLAVPVRAVSPRLKQ